MQTDELLVRLLQGSTESREEHLQRLDEERYTATCNLVEAKQMLAVVEHCGRLAGLPVVIAAPAPSNTKTDVWSTSTHTTDGREAAMTKEKNRKDAYRRVAELLERHLNRSHGIAAPVLAELRRIQVQMAAAGKVPSIVNTEVAQPG